MPQMFPKDALEFFAGCARIGARARARGELGADGHPIWSLAEWKAFCKGARSYSHLHMFSSAIVNTVHEVEAMLADGFDAASIHNVLRGYEAQREAKNQRRDPRAISYENVA